MSQDKDALIQELKRENRLLKISYCKCRDCRHADLYIPSYTYPFFDPRCSVTGNAIKPDDNACEDFQMIGRQSR